MESYYEKPVMMLNKLINDLNIGVEVFKKASASTNVENLKKLFNKIREKDTDYREQLVTEVKKYDGERLFQHKRESEKELSNSSKEIENVGGQNKNLEILKYCEKLEYDIQMDFSDAVHAEIPGETKDVVTEQYNQIRDFHDKLKVLIEREKNKNKETRVRN